MEVGCFALCPYLYVVSIFVLKKKKKNESFANLRLTGEVVCTTRSTLEEENAKHQDVEEENTTHQDPTIG